MQTVSVCASWGKALDLVLQLSFHPLLQRKGPDRLGTKRNYFEDTKFMSKSLWTLLKGAVYFPFL